MVYGMLHEHLHQLLYLVAGKVVSRLQLLVAQVSLPARGSLRVGGALLRAAVSAPVSTRRASARSPSPWPRAPAGSSPERGPAPERTPFSIRNGSFCHKFNECSSLVRSVAHSQGVSAANITFAEYMARRDVKSAPLLTTENLAPHSHRPFDDARSSGAAALTLRDARRRALSGHIAVARRARLTDLLPGRHAAHQARQPRRGGRRRNRSPRRARRRASPRRWLA